MMAPRQEAAQPRFGVVPSRLGPMRPPPQAPFQQSMYPSASPGFFGFSGQAGQETALQPLPYAHAPLEYSLRLVPLSLTALHFGPAAPLDNPYFTPILHSTAGENYDALTRDTHFQARAYNQGYMPNGASSGHPSLGQPAPGAVPLLPNQGRVVQSGPIRVLCIADVRGKKGVPEF